LLPVYQPLATKRRASAGRCTQDVVDGGPQVVKCPVISGACGIEAKHSGECPWRIFSPTFKLGIFANSED
jgi:hypothetical protein